MENRSSIGEIEFGEKIGEGSYGEVWKAVWKGKQVAAKRILPILVMEDYEDSQTKAVLAKFEKEWKILCSIQHENIVQYYTVILPPPPESPIIVTELLECDLAKHIRESKPKVPFSDVIKIMQDVAEGLHYIHTLKEPIVHRDLASKNVLLTKSLHAKIADLGQAKVFPRAAMYATAMPGTPVYAAPETYPTGLGGLPRGHNARYTVKIDIFSFGAMLLEICVGHLPVDNLPDPVLEGGEIVPEYIRRHEDLEELGPSHPLRNLVLQCLENSPEKRPSGGEIKDKLSKAASGTLSGSPSDERDAGMFHSHYDHKFKLVVLGESSVGKTSIVTRFLNVNKQLSEISFKRNVESEDHFVRLRLRDTDKSVHLHIVDVGGPSLTKASSLAPQIFRHARGAVIAFDLLSEKSFSEVPNWVKVVREKCFEGIPIILVGNKYDELDKRVDSQRVEQFAKRESVFYTEACAKSGKNIDEIFSVLVDLMIECEDKKEGEAMTRDLMVSLQETLSGKGASQEKSPIAERNLTPRHQALRDSGVILLNDKKEKRGTTEQDENGRKRKSWCCLLN